MKNIPLKRVLKVLSEFALAVLLFAFVDVICGISFTLPQFLLSLVGWESVGNSNWYIFVVLCLYLITFAGFMLGRGKEWISWGIVCALTVILFFILHDQKESWWYNTLTAYLLGMFVSMTKDKWNRYLEHRITYWLLLLSSLGVTIFLKPVSSHASLHLIMTVTYCIFILCVTKKVPIYQPILFWLGKHLFEIYILMRIPMIVLKRFCSMPTAIYVASCFAITLVLAFIYHKLLKKVFPA